MIELLNQETKELQESQKQIEEMAKDIIKTFSTEYIYAQSEVMKNISDINVLVSSLIAKGYRKIPEGAVVLTREEIEKYAKDCIVGRETGLDIINGLIARAERLQESTRKETAEKFAERLKDYINDKCCEELGDMACDTDYYTIDIPKTFDRIDEICKEITEGGNG